MPLSDVEQAEHKRRLVIEALAGHDLLSATKPRFVSVAPTLGYRNRLRLRVNDDGIVGYFNADKDLNCAVVMPAVRTLIGTLRAVSLSDPSLMAGVDYLEVRGPDIDGVSGIALYPRDGARIDRARLTQEMGSAVRVEIPPITAANDRQTQRFLVHGATWVRIPIGGFMQVNHGVNSALVSYVLERVADIQATSFLDLYCGAGNYTLPLATQGLNGYAVELDPAAILAAQDAADTQDIQDVTFEAGDAGQVAKRLVSEGARFDIVVANPPRAGLKETAYSAAQLARHGVILCSCDARSFARDIKVLKGNGWSLESVGIFDMFPHTRHVECCALLTPEA